GLVQPCSHTEMVSDGKPRIEGRLLGDETCALEQSRATPWICVEDADLASRGSQEAGGQMQQGGLPCTVGPTQVHYHARGDLQSAVTKRPVPPISLAKSAGHYDGTHATPAAKKLRVAVR